LIDAAFIARARIAVVSTIGILIAALVVWRVQTGFSTGDAVLIAVLALPLLIAVPRLLAGDRRTYAWMSLAVTPFLIVAITEAVANPMGRVWAGLCLAVAFLLFVLLIAYLRVTRDQT
jgi:uncharacterized membrane protein